ncbi:hypothetical protein SRB17_05560 [Streptomyces sp. RB17]|uniref:hypothetical protein n=1 Tax=Streptomyces sp. RB17 TaxID=2585197 RepID=UPI0012981BB7|nr:hypothetical protein [Streptomyces sp. RB17]MQY32602.1 hypothetical protein [Streptomyces sp. RB17]
MPSRRSSSNEPSLLVAIWWIFLAACAIVMFLGGINFISSLFGPDDEPRPAPTVTVTETFGPSPLATDVPDDVIDNELNDIPTPTACTDADARGIVPRDRWTPCGQILGYFDDWTTPPPGAPAVAP